MSIFSRLFKGPEEEGKESSEDDDLLLELEQSEASSEASADDQPRAATDPKGAMGPSFPVNGSGSDRAGAAPITAFPVVQVGDPGPTKESAAGAPRSPLQPDGPTAPKPPLPPTGTRSKPMGSTTLRSGSSPSAPPPPSRHALPGSLPGSVRPGLPPLPSAAAETGARPRTRAARTAPGLAPSARAAQAAAQSATPGSIAKGVAIESVNNLLDDLDAAFGAIVEPDSHMQGSPSLPPPPSLQPGRELRELFASLAANHMRQVREFMLGMKWDEPLRDWLSICAPAVDSLLRAAREMNLPDLSAALENYRNVLGDAAEASGATITGEARERIMAAYAALAELMPEAFGLEGERGRREAIIVHSLLQQVPDVPKVTIDKIYAAGLASFDQMFVAKADEISAMTGIGETVASRIVEKFQRYRREIPSLGDATRAPERRRLAELATHLRGLHHEFEQAASGWTEGARSDKKRLRQARTEALLEVKVMLARLGEIDRLGRLERLPFDRKIEELEVYLREAEAMEAPAR